MSTAPLRQWGTAITIAALLAGGRLLADIVVPPHLRWWLTSVVALTTSLLTSAIWITMLRLKAKGPTDGS